MTHQVALLLAAGQTPLAEAAGRYLLAPAKSLLTFIHPSCRTLRDGRPSPTSPPQNEREGWTVLRSIVFAADRVGDFNWTDVDDAYNVESDQLLFAGH